MAVRTADQLEESSLHAARMDPRLRGRSDRVERLHDLLRDRMRQTQKTWGTDLTVLDTPGAAGTPLVLRRAMAFRKTLLEMPIAIEDDDLIVGNTVQGGTIVRTELPSYTTREEHLQAIDEGIMFTDHLAHKTPYYRGVMERGLRGAVSDIDSRLEQIQIEPPSDTTREQMNVLKAARMECEAIIALANRYAALAETISAGNVSPARREELRRIASVCRRFPEHPPRTFHEAVQAFWLIHYAFFSTGTIISCGRLDQYLYPALRNEIEQGAITLREAQEICDCLWLRFNDRIQTVRDNFLNDDLKNEVWEWEAGHRKRFAYATDRADAINHFGQNILLGGIRTDGSDGTNELTYMCLNCLEKFAFTSPVVSLRLHRQSPLELVRRGAEVLKSGGGMPFLNNDDVLVQAYADLGVPMEDARDYANSNCWETMIEGKSDQELIRGMNFLLCLELALNRGVSSVHGQMGPDTGDPRSFARPEDLMEAWKRQLDRQLQLGIDHIGGGIRSGTLEHSRHGKYAYNPALTAMTLDCIQRAADVIRGGARYTIWHVMGEGVANAIDAMAVVRMLVFDEQAVTMDQLLAALGRDWDGFEDLRRRAVARVPKFANNAEYADSIGREMMSFFTERVRFHAARYPELVFPAAVGTFSWYVMIGKEVGATPDGRRDGEPVAVNLSPASGTDMSGPTAAISSYLKMSVADLAGGAPLDLRFSGSGLKGEAGTDRLVGLIRAFVDMGGNMLTVTVTDVEELKRAMKDPERYRHLRVRMGGWTAYFVMLSREQQLLHIARVEHGAA